MPYCKHCGQIVHKSDDFHDCEVKGMMHDKELYIEQGDAPSVHEDTPNTTEE